MAAHFSSFAVYGGGGLGKHIVEALVAQPEAKTVVLLRRPDSKNNLTIEGLIVETVDTTNHDALTAIFKKHKTEVVISATGLPGLEPQLDVAKAAHAAGSALFIPSDFGQYEENAEINDAYPREHFGNMHAVKNELAEKMREFIPVTRIFSQGFTEYAQFFIGLKDGVAHISGPGKGPIPFTAMSDIGKFIAIAFTANPPEKLLNKNLFIEGDRLSLVEVAALWGDKIQVKHVDTIPEEVTFGEFIQIVHKEAETGRMLINSGRDNNLAPGIKWLTVKEANGF